MPADLASLRLDYTRAGLAEADLAPTWLAQFERWFAEAAGVREPNAMVLGTSGVTARTVLLKGVDARGFVFFTNATSRKGTELAADPRCSLLFPWYDLERQVAVTGRAEPLPREETETYFRSRPRGSQVGAWASHQSALVTREALEQRYAELEARWEGGDVPVPPFWGGVVVVPESVEFWQGRPSRLHDRLRYRLESDVWVVERLSP